MTSLFACGSRCRRGRSIIRPGMVLVLGVCLAMLPGSVLSGGGPSPDTPPRFEPRRVSWERLAFRAESWKVDLAVDMALSRLPSAQVESGLLTASQGTPVKPSGAETMLITLEMMMDAVFQDPVNITNRVWFNPGDGAALGRFRLRRGEDDFEKTYRFTRQGVLRHNREPQGKAEAKLDPDQWSRKVDTFYAHDQEGLGCPVVSERLLLIYMVSALDPIAADAPLAVCVLGKRQLHRVTLSPEGEETITVDFREKRPGAETKRTGAVQARKIKLITEPLASDLNEPENFSFLGMHEDIVIHVDPDAGLPLQVSGRIKKFGAGELKLVEATLN